MANQLKIYLNNTLELSKFKFELLNTILERKSMKLSQTLTYSTPV